MLPSGPEWYKKIVPTDTYDQLREQERGGHLIFRRPLSHSQGARYRHLMIA